MDGLLANMFDVEAVHLSRIVLHVSANVIFFDSKKNLSLHGGDNLLICTLKSLSIALTDDIS